MQVSENLQLMLQPVPTQLLRCFAESAVPNCHLKIKTSKSRSREEVDETTLSVSLFRLLNVLATDRRHVV